MKGQRLHEIFGAQRESPAHCPVASAAVPFQVSGFSLGERPYLILVYCERHTISSMWGEERAGVVEKI